MGRRAHLYPRRKMLPVTATEVFVEFKTAADGAL